MALVARLCVMRISCWVSGLSCWPRRFLLFSLVGLLRFSCMPSSFVHGSLVGVWARLRVVAERPAQGFERGDVDPRRPYCGAGRFSSALALFRIFAYSYLRIHVNVCVCVCICVCACLYAYNLANPTHWTTQRVLTHEDILACVCVCVCRVLHGEVCHNVYLDSGVTWW